MVLVTRFLSLLTILSQLYLMLFLAIVLFRLQNRDPFRFVYRTSKNNYLLIAFIVAFTATLGSLYFSEILMYDPCKLCWFQRIFMYPLVIVLVIPLLKREKPPFLTVMALALIGGSISFYHYFLRIFTSTAACSLDTVSCLVEYFTEFGYITIPMMALTAFGLIVFFMVIGKKKKTEG